ncbi:hypothetical protein [Actinosynnema sp. ALI-1.44]|uniref:hypothetical protein n=1 Tax=Actinosynnema sp. ALI-1.44 TaxID=1933779 RepID=UPI00117813E7|nr:hypothetical protein [Actinosynnema sp. ALI-1.44]
MTSGEPGPPAGRHRHHQGSWTPQVTHPHAPAHARSDPALPGADPAKARTGPVPPVPPPTAAETTVPGLRKFDLGGIPASVTPPRTWRTAAWFAVGASLAVVFALSFAAAALVGKPKNTDSIDALPALPSSPAFLDAPPETSARSPQKPTTSRGPERPAAGPVPTQSHRGTTGGSLAEQNSSVQVSASPTSSESSESSESFAPPAGPVRVTTPKRAFATNDPQQIGDRTEAFYSLITRDPAAAYQMTTGGMRGQGEQAFRQNYADIESVEVREIHIDPNQGTTVSEVKITKKDGSTFTEPRRLKFTSGRDPKISSEVTH